MTINFFVPGVPVAQPRVKATARGGFARVYTPKTADAFKASVVLAASQAFKQPPIAGPVKLSVEFIFPRPKNAIWKTRPMPSMPHTKKPDCSNLIKGVEDCLNGVLWVDDSQIVTLEVLKRIASGDEIPGTFVEVEEV